MQKKQCHHNRHRQAMIQQENLGYDYCISASKVTIIEMCDINNFMGNLTFKLTIPYGM